MADLTNEQIIRFAVLDPFFCDDLCFDVTQALASRGWTSPDEAALVGFLDTDMGAYAGLQMRNLIQSISDLVCAQIPERPPRPPVPPPGSWMI